MKPIPCASPIVAVVRPLNPEMLPDLDMIDPGGARHIDLRVSVVLELEVRKQPAGRCKKMSQQARNATA